MQSERTSNVSCLEEIPPSLMKILNSEPKQVDKVNNVAPCVLDAADIEKGRREILNFSDDCVANLKSDDSLARDIWLQVGGKFMQLLMKHGTELPKFATRGSLAASVIIASVFSFPKV